MALSGVRDSAETVGDIINDALLLVHVLEEGETPEAPMSANGMRFLRRMLRTWAAQGVRLWLTEEQTVTLAADTATYALDPRTLEIRNAYRRSGDNDTPIRIFDREEYMRLPNKTVSGAPYAVWHDRQYNQSQVTVYPIPDGVGDTIRLTTKRQIQDVTTFTNHMEFPPEWSEAIVYNLAKRLLTPYPGLGAQEVAEIRSMADSLYDTMTAQDRGHSVHMRPRRR